MNKKFWMAGFLVIPKVYAVIASPFRSKSDDEGNVPFYKTPMAKLTTLELCGSVIGPVICDPGKELQKFNVKKMQASFQQEWVK